MASDPKLPPARYGAAGPDGIIPPAGAARKRRAPAHRKPAHRKPAQGKPAQGKPGP